MGRQDSRAHALFPVPAGDMGLGPELPAESQTIWGLFTSSNPVSPRFPSLASRGLWGREATTCHPEFGEGLGRSHPRGRLLASSPSILWPLLAPTSRMLSPPGDRASATSKGKATAHSSSATCSARRSGRAPRSGKVSVSLSWPGGLQLGALQAGRARAGRRGGERNPPPSLVVRAVRHRSALFLMKQLTLVSGSPN